MQLLVLELQLLSLLVELKDIGFHGEELVEVAAGVVLSVMYELVGLGAGDELHFPLELLKHRICLGRDPGPVSNRHGLIQY